MPLLVTGGTGFLGSYFVRHALTAGGLEHVVVLDRHPATQRIADVADKVTIIECDIADSEQVAAVVADHAIDQIAHFAFVVGSPQPGLMPAYAKIQLLGTANVLEAARVRKVRRVLFASSVAAYGRQSASILTEDLIVNPGEPYGAAKAWCEATARHYRDRLGLDTVTIRYGSTYGHGRSTRGSYASGIMALPQNAHYMARVENAALGRPVTMPRGDVLADFSYAADAAKAGWLALTADHLTHDLYNAPSARLPIGDFTRAMRALLPEADIRTDDNELPGNAHAPMNCCRIADDLGFTPDFSLEAGVADYIARIRAAN